MQNPVPRSLRISALLIGVSLLPFAATTNRLLWLSGASATPDPAMERFGGDWTMLVIHIVLGSSFLILAAPQFSPEIRSRHRRWHRAAGRIAMALGFVTGLSGVWLVLAYPPSELATPVMDASRVIFGAALAVFIILAFAAIRRRDIQSHRAWMIRAFALAVAGSTQALLIGLWLAFSGELTPNSATALITLGFVSNIAFAEWRLRALSQSSPILNPNRRSP